jgi:trk system potassium uptake protein
VKALVIGCGRVGSNVALQLAEEGWDVTGVDEKEEALSRLGENWRGGFILGHGMDVDVLREAGIEDADAVVVATDGDNMNIVIA